MKIASKPRLKIVVDQAAHFFRWEKPFLENHFEIVEKADENTLLYAFGPDVLSVAAALPALRRTIMLFPGFGLNPYHNLEYRQLALALINNYYDLVFINPGPLEVAYNFSKKVLLCPFTIDQNLIGCHSYRKTIKSLLHVSNPSPQKDWQRSCEIMQRTQLNYSVYPPRNQYGNTIARKTMIKHRINNFLEQKNIPFRINVSLLENCGYIDHKKVIKKYQQYDGFVHVASDVKSYNIDGKYTACTMEAGLTGSIVFWHDTYQLGNDFETFFDLPLEPQHAAEQILKISQNIDVEKHSKLTREEVLDKCDIKRSIDFRAKKIKDLL